MASSGVTSSPAAATENGHENCQMFTCNICVLSAKDPVISFCGHLFCWPCLHRAMEKASADSKKSPTAADGQSPSTAPNPTGNEMKSISCPVCKSQIDVDQIVPLYGRGGESVRDSRKTIAPPRPKGRNQPLSFGNISSSTDVVLALWFGFLIILWYFFA